MAIERPPRIIKPTEREAMQARWYKLAAAFDRELQAEMMSEKDRRLLLRRSDEGL